MSQDSVIDPGLYTTAHAQPPPDWRPLRACRLLILVGLTGVGKSTTVNALHRSGLPMTLLPNRRQLTDELIIGHIQRLDGLPPAPVTDRVHRFAYTRRYRELHPGGMAHALSSLVVAPSLADAPGWLLFDGLRGANEVTAAAGDLPDARFLVLDAPHRVRVQRLLGRNDAFDHVAESAAVGAGDLAITVPGAEAILGREGVAALQNLVTAGQVEAATLATKLKIVVSEAQNYSTQEAITALQATAPDRTLVVETTRSRPAETARLTRKWLP